MKYKIKRSLFLLLPMTLILLFTGCGNANTDAANHSSDLGLASNAATSSETAETSDDTAATVSAGTSDIELPDDDSILLADGSTLDLTGTHHVEIKVADYGTISVELDGDAAPISVENFLRLVASGFYDGLTFHRIIDGFMIQGGDPTGTGYGGSDDKIVGEFSSNGIENPLSHTRGAISMARSSANDSASSQFFIVQTDYPSLDGLYACFGYVTDGMDIVDQICKDTPVQDNNGTTLAEDQPVITSITIID